MNRVEYICYISCQLTSLHEYFSRRAWVAFDSHTPLAMICCSQGENLANFIYRGSPFTVTNLANSCVTPLFRRPQGSQGCLEKQNCPLSLNLVVWCAKIGPKTKKVQKTSELAKKMSKNDGFWMFFEVSEFWAQF